MNELTIVVTGRAGSGKTAISQIIHDALEAHGILVADAPSETAIARRSDFELGVVIGSLQAKGLSVKIVEQQLARAACTA